MSFQVSITGKDHYILVQLLGDVTIEKLIAANSYLYNDPDFISHPYAVWDFTECTIDTEKEQIAAFAHQILSSRPFSTPGKTAFITNDLVAQEMATPFIELVGELPIEIEGFTNRVSAVQWIESVQ